MKNIFIVIITMFTIAGCTSIDVKPVDNKESLASEGVCIKKNPKVIVPGFLIVIREGFSKNGIPTKVYKEGDIPKDCHYIMTYTALRSWDFVPYLSHAELHIESDGHIIAYGKYHLIGKGGLSFYKWASVRSKMNPVIDKMLNKSQ